MSWLRNIQGQLTELANEVLSEATEEVADPESELQVSKKKCAEAEKELAIEKSRATSLESQVKELEQQVYGANVEMDAISSKYGMMVQARDEEIKKMKIQLEQLNEAGWGNTADEDDFDMKSQQISDLQREVAHWKSLAAGSDGNADTVPRSEMERRLEELRQKKENELTAILEQHAETMNELRESYEERIQSLQQYPASSSTSNTDMLDAVLLEKEELLEEKRKLEEMVKSKSSSHSSDSEKEKPVMVDLSEGADDVFERLRLAEHEVERLQTEKDDRLAQATSEADSLKEQNRELAQAYNDLNEEFENFKRESQAVESRNVDLSERIASLRANLIEYEERYEVCKRENLETVAKLERLSGDFERLRCGIADVQSRRQDTDATMGEEVDKLRNALEESRTERERLRADVQRFQEAVSDIDNELEHLRASNRRLVEENALMAGNMERYDSTMRNIISSSENDIGEFREQFKSLQVTMTSEREATQRESEALREEVASLQRQNQLLAEESRLVQEVNNQLKTRGDTELKRVELFEEKIRILEELRKELSEELDGTKTEVENLKKELETKKKELEVSQSVPLYFPPSDEPEGSVGALQSQIRQLNAQLREALMANSEKTDECENLRDENRELEKEIGIRQNCVDEMIAQTNTLQIQQQIAAQATQELKQELLLKERQYLKVEQELVHERDHTADLVLVIRNLERIILGDDEGLEDDDVDEFANVPADMDCRASTSADSSTAAREAFEATSVNRAKVEELKRNSTTMKRYIRELKQKNEVQNAELEELKSQMENSTEEADATRSLLEKQLQEAEELDRGLLDGIEKRVAELEAELEDRRNALNEALKREKTQLRRVEELETECDLLKQQILDLTEKSPKPEESAAEVLEKMAEIEALKSKIALLENDVSVLTAEKQHQEAVQQEQLQKAPTEELHKENEELKKALVQKHGESVEYYTQLEAFAAKCAQLEAEAEQRTKKLAEVDGLYRSESDASEKKSRELDRLKQHLMLVEETSTREAVEAEQRETELRERVKELETLGSAATEDTSETIHMYQVRIETLKERLDSAQRYEAHWKSKFEAEQKAREQTQEALTSLQGVVRELSMDHERESAASSHRNLELQAEIEVLNETIGELRAELERHSLSRQSAEDDVERQKLQLEGKQKIIEELEVQIEEIRSTKSSKDTDSYRIDDGTLRQLFLNYFTAEPSKRADIALLLASILEYSPDDMEKVRKAVRQGNQSVASSFFGGGTRSSPGPSLTEQFVRFLEAESESARTAPHLPVRPASQPPQISLQGQASPNPQPPTSVTSPPSSAALDSLLR